MFFHRLLDHLSFQRIHHSEKLNAAVDPSLYVRSFATTLLPGRTLEPPIRFARRQARLKIEPTDW